LYTDDEYGRIAGWVEAVEVEYGDEEVEKGSVEYGKGAYGKGECGRGVAAPSSV